MRTMAYKAMKPRSHEYRIDIFESSISKAFCVVPEYNTIRGDSGELDIGQYQLHCTEHGSSHHKAKFKPDYWGDTLRTSFHHVG